MLFLTETNAHIAVWEGAKLDASQAFEVSGIKTVYWLQDWDRIIKEVMSQTEHVYLVTEEHLRRNNPVETRTMRLNKGLKETFPHHSFKRSAPALNALRAVKTSEEVEVMQIAADITAAGYDRILKFLKPGVTEFELEAEFTHEFLRRRSRGFAYTPIIGSGPSACVLHYIENNQLCKDGEVILLDVGAEYANYSSDLTRCIPVNGRFTARQKAVYNAVNTVKKEATKLLVPGTYWEQYHEEVGKLMTSELLGLGLLDKADIQNEDKNWPAYKKYFMHGTSHHIGLDTHDYGLLHLPIEKNMVFTVEPGIYIPKEGFGIRLEDDVVVQKSGEPLNLMGNIPIEADEIEALMNQL